MPVLYEAIGSYSLRWKNMSKTHANIHIPIQLNFHAEIQFVEFFVKRILYSRWWDKLRQAPKKKLREKTTTNVYILFDKCSNKYPSSLFNKQAFKRICVLFVFVFSENFWNVLNVRYTSACWLVRWQIRWNSFLFGVVKTPKHCIQRIFLNDVFRNLNLK